MLAWIRTGLALIAFGFVIARLGGWLRLISAAVGPTVASDHWTQAEASWIGASFVMLGTLSNAAAIIRYVAARRAIRLGREVADGLFPIMFGMIVTAVGGVVGLYLLWRMA